MQTSESKNKCVTTSAASARSGGQQITATAKPPARPRQLTPARAAAAAAAATATNLRGQPGERLLDTELAESSRHTGDNCLRTAPGTVRG